MARQRQYPPKNYGNSSKWTDRVRDIRERIQRDKAVGYNPRYQYSKGVNLNILTGTVIRDPTPAGYPGREFVWFRLSVQNQDRPGQFLFMPVRCARHLAVEVFTNVYAGDTVCVVGQLWSGRRPLRDGTWHNFTWLKAECVSPSYPVQMDHNPNYVRVRVDLFNRMAVQCKDLGDLQIPDDVAAEQERRARLEGSHWYDDLLLEVSEDPEVDHVDDDGFGDGQRESDRTDPVPERDP